MRIHHILRVFIAALTLASVSLAAESQRQTICLNGIWDYTAANTTEDQIPQGTWNTLPIPGDAAGHGAELFDITPTDLDTPHSWLRRTFYVPKSWADGRRVKLKFLGVDGPNKMFVNGQEIAKNSYETLAFVVDITDKVRFGEENQLAVWVKKVQHSYYMRGNIHRSVYLMCTPKVNIQYSHALPSVKNMTLTVRTRICNEDTAPRAITLNWVVKDNGKSVLTLPEKQVTLEPGQSVEVESAAPWADPVLWGFGKYGKPYLYHLQTTISGDSQADERFDRFGFREFTTKGPRFLFNGKPYFIKGDLISRFWPVTENPDFMATYYQMMRSANINFQRLHSHSPNNFDAHYWYQVADELGHLVEAQMTGQLESCMNGVGPDNPVFMGMWEAYVNENFNNPSLVMWCPDNEGIQNVIPNAEKVMPPWNRFATFLRKLDPTRIVDFHHGYELFAGVQMGVFDRENYMTFNRHPYADLVAAVEEGKKQTGFDDSVPVLIGEMFPHPSSIDLIGNPIGSYIEQKRRGVMLAENILRLYRYKVGGIILCALEEVAFLGFSNAKDLYLGPWSDFILVRDETKPNKPVIGERRCYVKVRWPSMSGEGTKCAWIRPTCDTVGAAGGYGFNVNWFDPTRPMFYSNITDKLVGDAYGKIGGKEVPLGPYRAPEVIVCFGVNGKPVEGAYVTLIPQDGQATPPSGIMTDKDGTAWFHFWDTGRYVAKVFYRENGEEKSAEKSFEIKSRPLLTGQAGYEYITWVDMGGIDIAQRQAELAKPAEFSSSTIRTKEELISNGDMEYWPKDQNFIIADWKERATQESKIVHSGKYSVKITGDVGQLCREFRLEKGCKYKISGWIYKVSGNRTGSIGLRNGKWDWLLQLKGSETPNEWVHVEAVYTATGEEMYFYCLNDYMGTDGACLYDDISVKKIGGEKKVSALQPGPFDLTDGGFIHNWLVLGPLPNEVVDRKFTGLRTDDLATVGGEAKAAPQFGEKVTVHFPNSEYWKEGDETLTWQYMASGDKVYLGDMQLPSRDIVYIPPVNVGAYLACWVESPDARQALLAIGSDDGYKMWLNGQLVGTVEEERGAVPDNEMYPVELKQGKNLLMVKLLQSIGGWECCVRFLNNDDKKPMTDLKIVLIP